MSPVSASRAARPSDAATEPDGGDAVFELIGIEKSYGATQALRGVDLSLRRGEFVGLLGPNGAGKSTLIKILDGVVHADTGTIDRRTPLGVVHQDLGLVETMTVAENMFLGTNAKGWLRPGREAAATTRALSLVGLESIEAFALVESLSLGQRTMVAVARLLNAGAQVVVVDEVTAGLHPTEAEWLVRKLRESAHGGATVLMVTHKLREIIDVADRFVVLMDGRTVLDTPAAATSLDALVEVMAHRRVASTTRGRTATRTSPEGGTGDGVLCSLRDVRTDRVGPVDLDIRAGTITGVTGLIGSGVHDVAYLVAGRVPPLRGTVTVAAGVRRGCVPAHRETEGVFADESEEFNLTAGVWSRWRTRTRLLGVKRLRADARAMAGQLSIVPANLDATVSALSGGNQQKVVLGRALIEDPDLLVLCEPTRGVDVATRRDIYHHVRQIASEGTAVFIASSDLEDLVALADAASIVGSDGTLGEWVTNERIADLAGELVVR